MNPGNLMSGLDKKATDFTKNAVLMTTSKYVKGGPVPIPNPKEPEQHLKLKHHHRHSRKLETQSHSSPESPPPQGLFQFLNIKNPKGKDLDESSSQNDHSKSKIERVSVKKELKSSSKSKEKQFGSQASSEVIEKVSPATDRNKRIADKRNVLDSKQTSYSHIPTKNRPSRQQERSPIHHNKKNVKSSAYGQPGLQEKYEQNAKRGSGVEKSPVCQRHAKNASKSREKLQQMKRQEEVQREEREKRQQQKVKGVHERKRRLEEQRQQERERKNSPLHLPLPNQLNKYQAEETQKKSKNQKQTKYETDEPKTQRKQSQHVQSPPQRFQRKNKNQQQKAIETKQKNEKKLQTAKKDLQTIQPSNRKFQRKKQSKQQPSARDKPVIQTKQVQPSTSRQKNQSEVKQQSNPNRFSRKPEEQITENKEQPENTPNRYGRKPNVARQEIESPKEPAKINRKFTQKEQERVSKQPQQANKLNQQQKQPYPIKKLNQRQNKEVENIKPEIVQPTNRYGKKPQTVSQQPQSNQNKKMNNKAISGSQQQTKNLQKMAKSHAIIYILKRMFKNAKQSALSHLKQFAVYKKETFKFSTTLIRTLNSVFESSRQRQRTQFMSKMKLQNGSILSKKLKDFKRANETNYKIMKNPLCSLLHSIGRSSQHFFIKKLKQNTKKISNCRKGIQRISSIEKSKLRSMFEHLLHQKRKIDLLRSFSFNQMISISQQNLKALKSQILMKLFSSSAKQLQPSQKRLRDAKISLENSEDITRKPQQRLVRSKTLNQFKQTGTQLQKSIKQKKQLYQKQKTSYQFRLEELRQLISENAYQVEFKKRQQSELKQALNRMSQNQNQFIEFQMLESQESKLPFLLQAYIFVRNQNEQIDINAIQSEFFYQPQNNIATIHEWHYFLRNLELKRLIDLYEGSASELSFVMRQKMKEEKIIRGFLKSFVQQKYLWEWSKKCIST